MNSQLPDHQSADDNHYTKEQTVSERYKRPFNCLQTYLTSSSLNQLIRLIKRIYYKIGKTRLMQPTYEITHQDKRQVFFLIVWMFYFDVRREVMKSHEKRFVLI